MRGNRLKKKKKKEEECKFYSMKKVSGSETYWVVEQFSEGSCNNLLVEKLKTIE